MIKINLQHIPLFLGAIGDDGDRARLAGAAITLAGLFKDKLASVFPIPIAALVDRMGRGLGVVRVTGFAVGCAGKFPLGIVDPLIGLSMHELELVVSGV